MTPSLCCKNGWQIGKKQDFLPEPYANNSIIELNPFKMCDQHGQWPPLTISNYWHDCSNLVLFLILDFNPMQ